MTRALASLLALFVWPLLATAAMAHAALIEASPPSGSTLETMPPSVDLSFSEPVAPMSFRLLLPDGTSTSLDGTVTGATVTIVVPNVELRGTYFVEWHVVSADGHPVAGTVALPLRVDAGKVPIPAVGDAQVRSALWMATLVAYAGAFFGVGGVSFSAFLHDPGQRASGRLVDVPLALATVGLIATIPLQGAETLGLPIAGMLDGVTGWTAFSTTYGPQVAGSVFAVLLAFVASRLRNAAGPPVALLALLTLCGAMVISGHVATAEPKWLAIGALVAHIAGFTFWIGALPLLLWSLIRRNSGSTAVLTTFSRLIVYAVGIIVVSGTSLGAIQMGPPSEAWFSPYGAALAAKLGVLIVLFAIAAWNRFVLTRPTLAGDERAARRLRTLVAVEILLMLVVLGLVSFWRFTPPPRVLAAAAAIEAQAASVREPIKTHLHASGLMADLEIVLGNEGAKAVVELYSEAPDPDIRSVRVRLTPPATDAVPLDLEATETSDTTWEGVAPPLTAGRWIAQVEVRVGDFDLVKMKGALRIP